VRTYTPIDDKPGIYFLGLDAGSRLAVAGARRQALRRLRASPRELPAVAL
jgi:uncharacterized protein YqjF (DUF2071 family)